MLKKLVPLCLIISSAYCMHPTISIDKFCRQIKELSPEEGIQRLLDLKTTESRGIRIKSEKLTNLFTTLTYSSETNPTLEEQFVQARSSINDCLATHFQDQKLRRALSSCLISLNKIRGFYNAS